MAKEKITVIAEDLLKEFLAENELYLWNTEFVKEGKDWFLRVYADKLPDTEGNERYIGIDECELISRFLSDKLDELDPIEQNYYLEVSSPGMDRALTKPEHYGMCKGKEIEVKLFKAYEGSKNYSGILISSDDEKLEIESGDAVLSIPREFISKVRLAVVF